MIRGKQLYLFWDDKLETYTFLREQIAPGASLPTFLARNNQTGQVSQVAPDFLAKSVKEACQRRIAELRSGIEANKAQRRQLVTIVSDLRASIKKAQAILKRNK